MSGFTIKFILAVLVLILGGILMARAQVPGSAIKMTVANDFVLRDKLYPAGEYTITRTDSPVDSPSVLILRGEGHAAIFDTIPASSNTAAKDTQIVFEKIGGVYFLSKIWVKGETTGAEIIRTKNEMGQIAKANIDNAYTIDETAFE